MQKLNRRTFLKRSGQALALSALPWGLLNSCQSKKQPNILFIMTDDHAFQAISAYDGKINQTPNIDRLANEGMRFNQSFCTNSICAPSRAVLLTGKYSHINGHINNALEFDGSQQTFPKLLQKAGYQTAMVGKWHLKSDPTGFDYWNVLPGQGHYYNPDFIEMGEHKRVPGYATDLTTDFAFEWLDKRDKQKPFCMLLHHKAPHRNWMPGPDHLTMYDDVEIPMPESYFDDYATRGEAAHEQAMEVARDMYLDYDLKVPLDKNEKDETTRERAGRLMWNGDYGRMNEEQRKAWDAVYDPKNEAFRKAKLKGKELAKWKYQRYMKDYLRCIASVDDNIGRVLDYLDQNGLSENTVVVYTSDQGFYLGEHGWFDKRFMYEESLRMPLMVRYPAEIQPKVNEQDMVMNLDFAPTFLDYAGVSVPNDIQGRSMRSVLTGNTPQDWRNSIYYHYYEYPGPHSVKRHYGVRTQRFKLIHFYHDIDSWELYDLQNDLQEMNNLYGKAEYAELTHKLKTELKRLREQYGDSDDNRFMPQPDIIIEHKALGKPVKYKHKYAKKYNAGGDSALTDGRRGPDEIIFDGDYSVWQGFEQNDLIATIDLGQNTAIKKIETGYLHNIQDWIFSPTAVQYQISDDGKNFKTVTEIKNDLNIKTNKSVRKAFVLDGPQAEGRYLRVVAKNVGICPKWHSGSGGSAWLFVDEIIVL